VYSVSTSFTGLSKSAFNAQAQLAFKQMITHLITGILPSDINITSAIEIYLHRRLAGYLRGRDADKLSASPNISAVPPSSSPTSSRPSNYPTSSSPSTSKPFSTGPSSSNPTTSVPTSNPPQSSMPSSTVPTTSHPSSSRPSSTEPSSLPSSASPSSVSAPTLLVSWQINLILEDFFKSSKSNSSIVSKSPAKFSNILSAALSNSTHMLVILKKSGCAAYLSVTSLASSEVASSPVEVLKTAYPTSSPSSSPTVLWENAKLSRIEQDATSTSQFMWLIALVIIVFISLPWYIYSYLQRGQKKQKELAQRLKKLRFEANKARLSEFELRRRDEMKVAFRAKFGRDINVYADCMPSSEGEVGQLQRANSFSHPQQHSFPGARYDQNTLLRSKSSKVFVDESLGYKMTTTAAAMRQTQQSPHFKIFPDSSRLSKPIDKVHEDHMISDGPNIINHKLKSKKNTSTRYVDLVVRKSDKAGSAPTTNQS